MLPILVKEIKRLSQDEGKTDQEIADLIGCARQTVNRARNQNHIPIANVNNRRDKTYRCGVCQRSVKIRRCEPLQFACPTCSGIVTKSK